MAKPKAVSIVGAGPAGLSAAVALAAQGVDVTVFEERHRVGARFQGDFQALENWTTDEGVQSWLLGLGLRLDCPMQPVEELTLTDASLAPRRLGGDRPLLYLVKRGPEADSLDRALEARAKSLGVRMHFGRRVRPEDLAGPVVVATGSSSTHVVAVGVIAETRHADQVVAITNDAIAPGCYAYCTVWDGRATLATGLLRDFDQAWLYFQQAREAFARLGLHDFRNERRFGGRANVGLGRALEQGSRVYVGEAAGLQDCLLWFGLRYALWSGHLAARSLVTGESYVGLVREHLRGQLRAGLVNRFLLDRMGDRGFRWLTRWVSRGNVLPRARRLYSLTPVHRLLWPLARLGGPARRHQLRAWAGWRSAP